MREEKDGRRGAKKEGENDAPASFDVNEKNIAEGQAGEERAMGVGPRYLMQLSFGCRD